MSDYEDEFDFENDELDLSYEDVYITRDIYEYIKSICKGTDLFGDLLEEELYEFLYPEKNKE
jgi:hypothetical protein